MPQQAALGQDRRAELEQLLKELRDESGIIQSRETELEEKIKARGDESTASPAAGRLSALEQKLEADRALLRATSRAGGTPARSAAVGARGDARIIRPAVVPDQPAYPRLALIWSVAAAGALALGMAVAFVLEALHGARA